MYLQQQPAEQTKNNLAILSLEGIEKEREENRNGSCKAFCVTRKRIKQN